MRIVEEECKSSSSSSIGNNSDDEDDAQSPYRYDDQNSNKISNGSLHDLEESLPMRRGISTFYNGKSKSFTCLAHAHAHPSIQDIAKPENAYTRKRRNLLATTLLSFKNNNRGGRISKKPNKPLLSNTQNLSSVPSFSMVNLHRCVVQDLA